MPAQPSHDPSPVRRDIPMFLRTAP